MYGILNIKTKTLTTYRKATTLTKFAKLLLIKNLKEEGREYNETNVKKHLEEWAETMTENSGELHTVSDCIDTIADHYVYCNIHLYNNREPLTTEEKRDLYVCLTRLLETYI